MRASRIVIADDHRIFRSGLRSLLETEPEFEVVGEASDGDEAEALVNSLTPDVLLLDLSMPKRSGVEVLDALSRAPRVTRTILLTAGVDTNEIMTALQRGARGVVL